MYYTLNHLAAIVASGQPAIHHEPCDREAGSRFFRIFSLGSLVEGLGFRDFGSRCYPFGLAPYLSRFAP